MKMVSNKLNVLNLLQAKLNQSQCHWRLYFLKHVFCRGVRFNQQGLLPVHHLHISHNVPYLRPPSPTNFALPLFFISPWYYSHPKGKQCLCNFCRRRRCCYYCFFWGGGQISCIMGDVQVAYCFSFAFAADNCGSIQSHLWRNVADSFCPTLPTLPFLKGGLSMQVSSQISLFHWIRFHCDGTCQWPLQG